MDLAIAKDFDSSSYDSAGTVLAPGGTALTIKPRFDWLGSGDSWQHYALRLYDRDGGNVPAIPITLDTTLRSWAANTNIALCFWSDDLTGDNWRRFDHLTVDGDLYTYQNDDPFPASNIYIAHMPLFPFARWTAKVMALTASPLVQSVAGNDAPYTLMTLPSRTADQDGRPIPALPLYFFQLTDTSVTAPKVEVILQNGQHADERHAYWMMEGSIDFLMSSDPVAVNLRKWCRFIIAPAVNPQGTYAGYVRSSPENKIRDHNRVWWGGSSLAPSHVLRLETAYPAAAPNAQVVLDYHNLGNSTGASSTWMFPLSYRKGAAFLAALRVYDPPIGYTNQSAQQIFSMWAQRTFDATLEISTILEASPSLAKTVESQRYYGELAMRAIHDMIVAGDLVPVGGSAPPTDIVHDLYVREQGTSAWTLLASDLTGDPVTASAELFLALDDGTYEYYWQAREGAHVGPASAVRTCVVGEPAPATIVHDFEYQPTALNPTIDPWTSLYVGRTDPDFLGSELLALSLSAGSYRYRWRGRDADTGHASPWSAARTFAVAAVVDPNDPRTPILRAPVDAAPRITADVTARPRISADVSAAPRIRVRVLLYDRELTMPLPTEIYLDNDLPVMVGEAEMINPDTYDREVGTGLPIEIFFSAADTISATPIAPALKLELVEQGAGSGIYTGMFQGADLTAHLLTAVGEERHLIVRSGTSLRMAGRVSVRETRAIGS